MDPELVRNQEEPLSEEVADAVRDDAVSLHFSEPETSSPASPMGGLASDCHHRSSLPGVHLIIDQMSQPLVVDGSDEDEILKSFA